MGESWKFFRSAAHRSRAFVRLGMGVLLGLVVSCGGVEKPAVSGKKRVVMSFTIFADMAREVAGDWVIVESITKQGAEIHGYPQAMAEFLAPLQYAFMRDALLVGTMVATMCAVLSCFLMLKGWSLMGDPLRMRFYLESCWPISSGCHLPTARALLACSVR